MEPPADTAHSATPDAMHHFSPLGALGEVVLLSAPTFLVVFPAFLHCDFRRFLTRSVSRCGLRTLHRCVGTDAVVVGVYLAV